ncbi:thioredoxin, partial [Dysosmobacter welbionis]
WMKSARHQGWEIRRNRSCGRQSSPSAGRPPVEKRPLPACCRRWSIWARPWAAPSRARRPWKRFGLPPGTWQPPSGTCPTRWQRSPAFCGTAATKRRWERRLKPWRI